MKTENSFLAPPQTTTQPTRNIYLGVDYTLPALGGCFGPNCKVAYGYDLVGNNFNGSLESIQESNDPMDSCTSNSSKYLCHKQLYHNIVTETKPTIFVYFLFKQLQQRVMVLLSLVLLQQKTKKM